MKLASVFLFLFLLLASCDPHFNEKELYGNYVPINFKNTYDTIQLESNGLYTRHVYDRNRKIVLNMRGNWSLISNHIIDFNSFYLNFDDALIRFPNSTLDTSVEWQVSLESKNKTIQFCVGNIKDTYCYKKLNTK